MRILIVEDETRIAADLAEAVNTSLFYFCKLFRRVTGMTFTEFVNRARVEQAKRLLGPIEEAVAKAEKMGVKV